MRLVCVEWVDSFGCSADWQDLPDVASAPAPVTCRSVGWLLHDADDCKTIVPHLSDAQHDHVKHQGCGDMTIPTCSIRRIVDLAEVDAPDISASPAR